MIARRQTKQITIGNVKIGAGAQISVQSMTNTDTRDVQTTLFQIKELAQAGCELVRLAVLNSDASKAIGEIKKKSPLPIIADIHFDYRLALQCINNGVDALRINPGNIGKEVSEKRQEGNFFTEYKLDNESTKTEEEKKKEEEEKEKEQSKKAA